MVYKPFALATPFMIFFAYLEWSSNQRIGLAAIFTLAGLIGIYMWIQEWRKNNFLKKSLDWVG